MDPKLTVYYSQSFNPYLNLAIEDWIFKHMNEDEQILYLWRNDNTVVIGRFQNPWAECRVKEIENDGAFLARRQSGGGAVYHDLGNTNFTFFSSKNRYSKERNIQIITESLSALGIDASLSGRNDILVNGKKISGSAFKLTSSKAFHHGTLLLRTDLGNLEYYLNPDREKLESKGIASIHSRVLNLSELKPSITHETLCESIVDRFSAMYWGTRNPLVLTEDAAMENPEITAKYEEYADWEWRIGRTPRFTLRLTNRFSWGSVELCLYTRHGTVEEVALYSDTLDEEPLTIIKEVLTCSRCNRPFSEWMHDARTQAEAGRRDGARSRDCTYSQSVDHDQIGFKRWEERLHEFFSWYSEKM